MARCSRQHAQHNSCVTQADHNDISRRLVCLGLNLQHNQESLLVMPLDLTNMMPELLPRDVKIFNTLCCEGQIVHRHYES